MVRLNRRALLKTGAVAASGIVGAASVPDSVGATDAVWASFQYDEANTGYNGSGAAPTDGLSEERTYELDHRFAGSPLLADGKLFVGAEKQYGTDGQPKLRAFDTSDGSVAWSVDGFETAGLTVQDGTLYASDTYISHLHAIDTQTGEVDWLRETGDGAVVYESTNDVVFSAGYGLDPATGQDRWSASATPSGTVSHAARDGSIYYLGGTDSDGYQENDLVAIAADDGSERWRRNANHTSVPTVTADAVYVGEEYARIRAYDSGDGSDLWTSRDLGQDLVSSVAVAGDSVYLASGVVAALDTADGSVRWEVEPDPTPYASPVVVDDALYVPARGQDEAVVLVLDSADGSEIARVSVPGVGDVVAAADGSLYTGSENVHEVTGGGGGSGVSLSLTMNGDTAEPNGTATIEYVLSNEGGATATGLQGVVDPPSSDWAIVEAGGFTTLAPGETETVTVDFTVPDDASGEYFFEGWVEDDADNRASDSATVTVDTGECQEDCMTVSTTPESLTLGNGDQETVTVEIANPADFERYPGVGVQYYPPEGERTLWGYELTNLDNPDDWLWQTEPKSGNWASNSVTVPAGGSVERQFDVAIAESAEAGDHSIDVVVWDTVRVSCGPACDAVEFVKHDETSVDVTVESGPAFAPDTHGFGFQNWAGSDPANGDFDPDHDHEGLDAAWAEQAADSWAPDINDVSPVPVPDAAVTDFVAEVADDFTDGAFTTGHCYGMVFAAEDYFDAGLPDGVPAASASEVPQPTGDYSAVGDDIDEFQNEQALDWDVMSQGNALSPPDIPFAGDPAVDFQAEYDRITDRIDEAGVAPVGLGQSPEDGGLFGGSLHQVLAYDYESTNDGYWLYVYNPNLEAGDSPSNYAPPEYISLTDDGELTMDTYYVGSTPYDRLGLIGAARADTAGMLAGGAEVLGSIVVHLLGTAVGGLISVAANSPVEVAATAPDGTPFDRPTEPIDGTPPEEMCYLTGADSGDYGIEVTGTGDGEYTIDVRGSVPGAGSVAGSVTGTISEGETRTLTATVPDDPGEEGSVGDDDDDSIVDQYDANDDGAIDIGELNDAAQDYVAGDLSITELNQVAQAYINS